MVSKVLTVGRKLMAAFYVLVGPVLTVAIFPGDKDALSLALIAGLSGISVARVHWRQSGSQGRWGVAVGTLLGSAAGFVAFCAALLMLAFAGDSGEHGKLIGQLMLGTTVTILLLAPTMGALAGSGLAGFLARRKASHGTRQNEVA